MHGLSIAQLAIYATLTIPSFYVLWKHGKAGLLGWFYLIAFFGIRMVGSGLDLSNSPSAAIVSSIGLSPLLLATAGILHEARVLRTKMDDTTRKMEWLRVIVYHFLVTGALAITAAGTSKMYKPDAQPGDAKMAKVGLGIMLTCWIILSGWIILSALPLDSLRQPRRSRGTLLLLATIVAIPLLGVRVVYGLVLIASGSTASLAIQVIFSFLPELFIAICYIATGIYSASVEDYASVVVNRDQHCMDSV